MRFDFAISFAGPDRDLARQLASSLSRRQARVFFDEHFLHEMLGNDGLDYLNDVFFEQSLFSVVLISANYDKSAWTQVERRAISARELKSGEASLLPILVDGCKPSWLLPNRIYFDLSSQDIESLADLLMKKLPKRNNANFVSVREIELEAEDSVHPINDSEAFTICTRFGYGDENNRDGPVRTLSKTHEGWQLVDTGVSGKAKFAHRSGDMLALVPENSDYGVTIVNLHSRQATHIRIPRQSRWTQINGCAIRASEIVLGCCGGAGWHLQMDTALLSPIRPTDPERVDHTFCAVSQTGRVCLATPYGGVIYSKGSEGVWQPIGEFEVDEGEEILTCGYCAALDKYILPAIGQVYLLDGDTGELLNTASLASPFGFGLSCATKSDTFAIAGGFAGRTPNVEVYDARDGSCLAKIPCFKGQLWESAALSNSGLTLCCVAWTRDIHAKKKLVIFEKRDS